MRSLVAAIITTISNNKVVVAAETDQCHLETKQEPTQDRQCGQTAVGTANKTLETLTTTQMVEAIQKHMCTHALILGNAGKTVIEKTFTQHSQSVVLGSTSCRGL